MRSSWDAEKLKLSPDGENSGSKNVYKAMVGPDCLLLVGVWSEKVGFVLARLTGI